MLDGYKYHKLECRKCKRKILVEKVLVGVDHDMSIDVICADCLDKPGKMFAKQHPKAVIDIWSWAGKLV